MRDPFSPWRRAILARFNDRKDIGKREIYIRYFKPRGLDEDCVMECLELIETEYQIPAGVFRPEDKLEKLFEPVRTKNPLRWLIYRAHEGDSETEINYQLGKRMRRYGTIQSWSHVKHFGNLTLGDLIKAWCGRKPSDEELGAAQL